MLLGGRTGTLVYAILKSDDPGIRDEALRVEHDLRSIGLAVRTRAFPDPLAAASARATDVDLLGGATFGRYPDPLAFVEQTIDLLPGAWVPSSVRARLAAAHGLTGDDRRAAAVAIARDVAGPGGTVIPRGNGFQSTYFSGRVGCQLYTAAAYGVDLVHLCPKAGG
jgi:hypothetical protein